ncbi:MAG: flagellar basal-body rod protein FlgC, partial [Pirellulaceae bacterium]
TGVKVERIETEDVEPEYKHQPNHPMAIKEGPKKGFVAYPNINMTREMVDAMEATRAYEANIGVMEISKNLGQQTLRILA